MEDLLSKPTLTAPFIETSGKLFQKSEAKIKQNVLKAHKYVFLNVSISHIHCEEHKRQRANGTEVLQKF